MSEENRVRRQILPSDEAVEGAQALDGVLTKLIAGNPVVAYVRDGIERGWKTVQSGDWDRLAAGEEQGGFGLTLRDLVEVAQVLGKHILPAPVTTSVVLRALTDTGATSTAPLGVAIPRRSLPSQAGVAYGAFPDIKVVNLPAGATITPYDGFAPSLRMGVVDGTVPPVEPVVRHWLSVLWAAEAVGAAHKLLLEAVEYAKIREQYGQPIGSFQSIKHMLADSQLAHQEALTATVWTANDIDAPPGALRLAFKRCMSISEAAAQVHGGIGMTWELGHHFYTRHIVTLRDLVEDLLALEGH